MEWVFWGGDQPCARCVRMDYVVVWRGCCVCVFVFYVFGPGEAVFFCETGGRREKKDNSVWCKGRFCFGGYLLIHSFERSLHVSSTPPPPSARSLKYYLPSL